MLNEYFGVALPAILEQGGLPTQLAGDAVMAVFGAPGSRRLINVRVRALPPLPFLERTEGRWPPARVRLPRFHIGINSGPALVVHIESGQPTSRPSGTRRILPRDSGALPSPVRSVIGPVTAADLDGRFELSPLGPVTVKGRVEPDTGIHAASLLEHQTTGAWSAFAS